MNESFKMDNITIEIDEYGYIVNCSNPEFIKWVQYELAKLRDNEEDTNLYYLTKDLKQYFMFDLDHYRVVVDVFDADKLSDKEKGIFTFTMYNIDNLLGGLENED